MSRHFGTLLTLLFTVTVVVGVPGPARGHRLKGSATASDALLVQRGSEAFSRGTFAKSTRLDEEGRVALAIDGDPDTLADGRGWYGEYVSGPLELPFPVREILPAWNVDFDVEVEGFAVDMRFRRAGQEDTDGFVDEAWTAWYHLGADGVEDPSSLPLHLEDADAFVDEDYVLTTPTVTAAQWRWRAWRRAEAPDPEAAARPAPRLRLFTLAVSDPRPPGVEPDPASQSGVAVAGFELQAFPWRSQIMGTRIDGRICCATSVNMTRAYYGVVEPTIDTTQRCLDRRLKMYGSWPRATQVLSEVGLDAWIERFRTLDQTKPYLEQGIPILISIKARRGQLFNAPYERTGGHVLVLRGFDAEGNPLVSDPATRDRSKGYTKWTPEELQAVWLGNGGVGMLSARRDLGWPKPYVRHAGIAAAAQ